MAMRSNLTEVKASKITTTDRVMMTMKTIKRKKKKRSLTLQVSQEVITMKAE
jgi:hypothetical protein